MRLLIINFCFLVIFMATIRTSSSAITQANFGAVEDTSKTVRKTCTTSADCNDQNLCTGDTCQDNECHYEVFSCEDGDASTNDCCHPTDGCITAISPALPCNDNNACTDDSCNSGVCSFIDKTCNDGNPCTINSCDPQSGCTFPPDERKCDDQNACTTDTCTPVQFPCSYEPIICDGGNACTDSFCNPALGCQYPPKVCDDGNPCTINSCDTQFGCTFPPDETFCDDQNACTTDTCTPGEQFPCSYTTIICDGGNACTDSFCLPALGCQYPPKACDDMNPCTKNTCNSETGDCEFPPDETVCDDHDACTTDTCTPGQQFPCDNFPITCDDGNPCTDNVCDASLGCQYPAKAQCSAQCPCTGDSNCECNGGTCTCVPNPPPTVPCAPRCETTMTFNLDTCGPATIPCSGTP